MPLIPAHQSVHYAFPWTGEKFPQLDARAYQPELHLALADLHLGGVENPQQTEGGKNGEDTDKRADVQWSAGIEMTTAHDGIVNVPRAIDVKVHIEKICHTAHVYLERVNRAAVTTCEVRDNVIGHETVVVMDAAKPASSPGNGHRGNLLLRGMETSQKSEFSLTSSYVMVASPPPPPPERQIQKREQKYSKMTLHAHCIQVCVILLDDSVTDTVNEILRLHVDNIFLAVRPAPASPHVQRYSTIVSFGAVQLDNQMFVKGKYDFPVILMPQTVADLDDDDIDDFLGSVCPNALDALCKRSFVCLKFVVEHDVRDGRVAVVTADVSCQPLVAYIEDGFVYDVIDLMTSFAPPNRQRRPAAATAVPKTVTSTAASLNRPIRLQHLLVQPMSACVSVHASLKMFIGLDNSPLHFGKFEKWDVHTTTQHLTRILTMHYVSAAIFRAGKRRLRRLNSNI